MNFLITNIFSIFLIYFLAFSEQIYLRRFDLRLSNICLDCCHTSLPLPLAGLFPPMLFVTVQYCTGAPPVRNVQIFELLRMRIANSQIL